MRDQAGLRQSMGTTAIGAGPEKTLLCHLTRDAFKATVEDAKRVSVKADGRVTDAISLRAESGRNGFEVVSNLEKGGCGFGRDI
jgi:hypothetical protein